MNPPDHLLAVLDELENLEARLLSWGVAEVALSRDEVGGAIRAVTADASEEELLQDLLDENLLVALGEDRYRTRTAEAVRLASSLRQWFGSGDYGKVKAGGAHQDFPDQNLPSLSELGTWQDTKHLVSDFRFRAIPRSRPRRDRTRAEVLEGVRAIASEALLQALTDLVPEAVSRFQEQSLQTLLSWRDADRDTAAIVTAGTGAGKTYAFFLPVLAHLATHRGSGRCPQALAIYPRNALLKDQLRVAFGLCRDLDAVATQSRSKRITMGALFGEVPKDAASVASKPAGKGGWKSLGDGHLCPFFGCPKCGGEVVWKDSDRKRDRHRVTCLSHDCGHQTTDGDLVLTRDRLKKDPPDVLFSSMEMLHRWLQESGADQVIGGRQACPRFVLLDEVHTYGGVSGSQSAYVLRRWRHRVAVPSRAVAWVGLSATLERPTDFFRQLVPIPESVEVLHLSPGEADMEQVGKQYALLLKGNPFTQAALLAVTIQALMLLQRACTVPSKTSAGDWRARVFGHKTFAFTDTLDVFSRLEGDLNDAEGKLLPWLRASHPSEDLGDRQQRQDAGQLWSMPEKAGWSLGNPLDVRSLSSKWQDDLGGADVVVATSSLEVGLDDDEVNVVLQHKTPRDWASYLQRMGRAGRQMSMRPWAVTVLSDYGRDGVAFQNYHEFFEPALRYNPVPVENAYVLRIQAAHAVLDHLAQKCGVGKLAWKLSQGVQEVLDHEAGVQGERKYPLSEGDTEKVQRQVEQWLDDPDSLREVIAKRLRRNQDGLLESVLYQPPRSILYEFLPALARLVRKEGTREEAAPNGALGYFLPGALFKPLDLSEVELHFADVEGRQESMPVEQFLSEFAPLKASKRFAGKSHFSSGHWFAPQDLGPLLRTCVAEAAQTGEPVTVPLDLTCLGRFEPERTKGGDHGEVEVVRPLQVELREQQGERFNERSNSWLDWQTKMVTPGENLLQAAELPLDSPVARWVTGFQFALHSHGLPVTALRFAESARAVLQHKSNVKQFGLMEGQEVKVTFHRGDGTPPVALGFAQEVDGLALVVSEEALAGLRDPHAGEISAAERSDYFQESFRNRWEGEVLGTVGLSPFQLDRLSGLFLGELAAWSVRKEKPVPDRLGRWKSKPAALSKALGLAADLLYKRPALEVLDLEMTAVRDGLDGLLSSDPMLGSLLELAPILHQEPADAEWWTPFVEWRQRRALAALGATFLQAVQALLPDLDVESLRVDLALADPEAGTAARVWITEATPGGIGNVLQVRELCLAREADFLWAWSEAIQPGQAERTSEDLSTIVGQVADPASRLATAAGAYRQAGSVAAQESAVREVQGAVEAQGIPFRHGLRTPLFSRILAPGSGVGLDRLTTLVGQLTAGADAALPFECPPEATQLLIAAQDGPDWVKALTGRHPWQHEWARLQDDPSSRLAKAWKAQRMAGLIWPRDRARAQQEVGTYNRFARGQQMDLDLLRSGIPVVPAVEIGGGRSAEDWWPELAKAVEASPAEVHLRAGPSERRDLAEAARWLAMTPMDSDVLSVYLRVIAVRRDAQGWCMVVRVPELVR